MENKFVYKLNYIVLSLLAGLICSGLGFGLFLAFSKAGITIDNSLSFTILFIVIMNIMLYLNNILGGYFYNVAYGLPHSGFSTKIIQLAIYQVVLNLVALPFLFIAIANGFLTVFILTICFIAINNLFEIFLLRTSSNENPSGALIGCFLTLMIALSVAFNLENIKDLFVPLSLLFLILSNFLGALGSEVG